MLDPEPEPGRLCGKDGSLCRGEVAWYTLSGAFVCSGRSPIKLCTCPGRICLQDILPLDGDFGMVCYLEWICSDLRLSLFYTVTG